MSNEKKGHIALGAGWVFTIVGWCLPGKLSPAPLVVLGLGATCFAISGYYARLCFQELKNQLA